MQKHGQKLGSFKDSTLADNSLLHFAVQLNSKDLMKFLLTDECFTGQIDVNQRNANGETPLHYCCSSRNRGYNDENMLPIAKILLLYGADSNLKNSLGDTAESLA